MLRRGGVLTVALPALRVQTQASEALWNLLKAGGQVVTMRHESTDPTAGDPDTMRLEDCSAQRNLSASWRDDGRREEGDLPVRAVGSGAAAMSRQAREMD
jgi:hypothetical protein